MMTLESSQSDTPNCGITYPCNWWQANDKAMAKKIYSTSITYDCHILSSKYCYGAGHKRKPLTLGDLKLQNVLFQMFHLKREMNKKKQNLKPKKWKFNSTLKGK
jgi:hypothetical protein